MQKYINEKNIIFHRNIIFLKTPDKPGLMVLTKKLKKPPTLIYTLVFFCIHIHTHTHIHSLEEAQVYNYV